MSKKGNVEKKNPKKANKIMVFGTFDGLHPGHLDFFRQAKNFIKNSFLIVSIARDQNVKKIKGQKPILNEKKRAKLVKTAEHVDKVVLAGLKNYLPHIVKERPEVIALGYDQSAYVKNLKKDLKGEGLKVKIIRLRPYKVKIYKNSLLKKKSRIK